MPLLQTINPLIAFKEGTEEGFTYYFNLWYKPLCFFAKSYTKDSNIAEDITGESFIRLWSKRSQFDTESGLKAYLYQTVYNACLRHIENKQRYLKHHSIIKQEATTEEQSCFHKIIKAETIHLIHKAIDSLPLQCRKVFIKLYIEQKTVTEIAGEMNLAKSTIKNQHARGLKLLKPKLISRV